MESTTKRGVGELPIDEDLLNIIGLKTYFYTLEGILRAVDGVDLKILKKETVGLVGESGCGKTVTALSILRLVPHPGKIVGGKILFKGKNLLELSIEEIRGLRGKEISMIFQDPATYLHPTLKIGDQIGEVIENFSMENKDIKGKVIEALASVGIPSPSKHYSYHPHKLSGGMRQRVVIAASLIGKPSLVIADEPTTALDVTVQAQILSLMKDLKEKLGLSVLLITHDLGIVADICDRVYIMYAGKIVEYTDVFTIYENPKHPYTEGLLESVLSINEYKEKLTVIEGTVPNPLHFPQGCRFHPRCKYRKDICCELEPPSIDVDTQHVVACWLYAES